MFRTRPAARRRLFSLAAAYLLALAPLPPAARAQEPLIPVIAPGAAYRVTHLVSDSPGMAPVQDPLLVNPWGISMTSTSPFWTANAGTNTSSLYRGDVGGQPLVKNAGLPHVNIPGGPPTGTVANTTSDFVFTAECVNPPCPSGAARFLFVTLAGRLVGWFPALGDTARVVATRPGAVYTGLAIGNNGAANFLYAADVANGRVDVYNSSFALQPAAGFPFLDPTLPPLYHPFNVQALGGELYVAYARVDPMTGRDVKGFGAVSVFDFNGVFKRRIHLDGPLSAPWGLALAPASFGVFSNALLVGNFDFGANARISAFNRTTGAFLGQLQNEAGTPITIDGLWAITFGNGGSGGDPNKLYFAAGIGHEGHGLFGSIQPTTGNATSLFHFATDEFVIVESSPHIDITVVRAGNVTQAASVHYATFDDALPQQASQKSDYQIAVGRLDFAPGETSKTFRVLFTEDGFSETTEVIDLVLSNPSGAGAGLGSPSTAEIKVIDPGGPVLGTNPIDQTRPFVRQHYLDFLNRLPDAPGLQFWSSHIDACPTAECRRARRADVSAAFFLSIEFQETGLVNILTHHAAFGRRPLYGEFMVGTQALQRGVVFGTPGAAEQIEANKRAFFDDFVNQPEFVSRYGSLSNEAYVDALLTTAALRPEDVRLFVVQMTNAQENPPANPTASGGGPRPASFGTARLLFNADQTALTLNATVNNIDFTGSQTPGEPNDNLTNAHIHASATLTPTTNAGVVWGFIGTPFNDNNPNDLVILPFTGGVGAEVRAKWDAPEGNNTTLAAQLANLRAGRAYINFHTTQFPGGEIRGNIPAADAFRNSLVAGLNAGAFTRAQVLRHVAESEELKLRHFNSAFVLMQYFGYLRRDPDEPGFQFWLNKLNQFNGDFRRAEMVRAFIESIEYRQRFGS